MTNKSILDDIFIPDWKASLSTNCLLIIDENSPLNFALEMLLVPSSGVDAVKSVSRNFHGLVDEACALNSQVVILEDDVSETGESALSQLLMSKPELKIIVVLRDSNYIHVFRKEEVLIQNASEFIEIIRSR
jgi:hypothetical protein